MANTDKMTSKKAFACIMGTKGEMNQILTVCNNNNVRAGYNTVWSLAQKYMADFDNINTHCTPSTAQQNVQTQAIA